jgi:hypothetical protein
MNMPVRAALGGQFLKHILAGYLAPCPRFAGRWAALPLSSLRAAGGDSAML